jgi:hypothetical protein
VQILTCGRFRDGWLSRLHDLASAQQSPMVEMTEVIAALGLALEALRVLGEEVNDFKAAKLNLNPDG